MVTNTNILHLDSHTLTITSFIYSNNII